MGIEMFNKKSHTKALYSGPFMAEKKHFEKRNGKVVLYIFMGEDPMDCVATCMNYRINKVVYLGYQKNIDKLQNQVKTFLRQECGVKETLFIPLEYDNLQKILMVMREQIEQEITPHEEKGFEGLVSNQIYFDITGGEHLILTAFGRLSGEYDAPIHRYDIVADVVKEYDEGATQTLSLDVPKRKVKFNLDKFIKLQGGFLYNKAREEIKREADPVYLRDVNNVYSLCIKYKNDWTNLSEFFRNHFKENENGVVLVSTAKIEKILAPKEGAAKDKDKDKLDKKKLDSFIDDLSDFQILQKVTCNDSMYSFRYKNEYAKNLIWMAGASLEVHVFNQLKKKNDDCRLSVNLDWDGEIQPIGKVDVYNEVDVVVLKGNIPTFISCKSGQMTQKVVLPALYELNTVAKKFGGKYARMQLITIRPLSGSARERAKEMGIDVVVLNN